MVEGGIWIWAALPPRCAWRMLEGGNKPYMNGMFVNDHDTQMINRTK